jgi:predicted ATP-binding protein involved in virulence
MKAAVDRLVALAGYSYAGLDAPSFEPMFQAADGRSLPFDALPTRVRHLVAFAALSVRVLWAAHPGRDPRTTQGVIAIDEVDAHQDPAIQGALVSALSEALPEAQWILTTTSPVVAGSCDTRDVLALRKLPRTSRVELYLGCEARTH